MIYVGVLRSHYKREVFQAQETPTANSHGEKYIYVIGPFQTQAGAQFMRDYGRNNPHCQHVDDAERLAAKRDTQLAHFYQTVFSQAVFADERQAQAEAQAAGICTCPPGWSGYICDHCGRHACDNGEHQDECPDQRTND